MGTTLENRARRREVWRVTTTWGRAARRLAVLLALIGGIAWIAGAPGDVQARIWLAAGAARRAHDHAGEAMTALVAPLAMLGLAALCVGALLVAEFGPRWAASLRRHRAILRARWTLVRARWTLANCILRADDLYVPSHPHSVEFEDALDAEREAHARLVELTGGER